MTAPQYTVDDRVRIDIPDEEDPDHDSYHGKHGTIIEIFEDEADTETGDPRDAYLYRIDIDSGGTADFRWRDVRPSSDTEYSEE